MQFEGRRTNNLHTIRQVVSCGKQVSCMTLVVFTQLRSIVFVVNVLPTSKRGKSSAGGPLCALETAAESAHW